MTKRHPTLDEIDGDIDDISAASVDYRMRSALCEAPIAKLDMSAKLVTIYPDDSCLLAIEKMKECHCGAVVVLDPQTQKLAGIMTERDLMNKFIGRGLNPANEAVSKYMTSNPEYLAAQDKIAYALNKMSVLGFRHVPIADLEKNVIGIISMRDIIDYIADGLSNVVYNLRPDPLRMGFEEPEGA